ncbi:MAG: hypothetical protein KH020_20960 [Clostridiales bacterium]|nr:hypothetical protein [Clostridiales bacterium]
MQVKIKKNIEKPVGRIKRGSVFELEGKFFIATEEYEVYGTEQRRCIELKSGCNHWLDVKTMVLEKRAKLKIKE